MSLDPQQQLRLTDQQARNLGVVSIGRIEGDRVYGSFVPEPECDDVMELFRQLEEAVNEQLFVEVERLQILIHALSPRLTSAIGSDGLQLSDVQVMNASDFSCRIPNLALTQALHTSAQAG